MNKNRFPMKYLLISMLFLTGINTDLFGQLEKDKIVIERVFGGYKYTQNGKVLKMSQMENLMKSDDLAFKNMRAARVTNTLTTIFGAVGGVLIGWPVGTAIAGGDPNWTLAYIGGGLIVVSIPLSVSGRKKAWKAVEIFNANLVSQRFYNSKNELRICFSTSGMGLKFDF